MKALVPTARLELAQLSPLPPQDSVSTNFTTSARCDRAIRSLRREFTSDSARSRHRRSSIRPDSISARRCRRTLAAPAPEVARRAGDGAGRSATGGGTTGRSILERPHGPPAAATPTARAGPCGGASPGCPQPAMPAPSLASGFRAPRPIVGEERKRQRAHEERPRPAPPVERDRKLAEPVAPNRLPEAPNRTPRPCRPPCHAEAAPAGSRRAPTAPARPRQSVLNQLPILSLSRSVRARRRSRSRDRGLADRDEVFGDQGRAADQAAIDVVLLEQLERIVGLDRAAVQDPDCAATGSPASSPADPDSRSNVGAGKRAPPAPAPASRSGRYRSPRPVRRPARIAGVDAGKDRDDRFQLPGEHRFGHVRLPLLERLAEADHRPEAVLEVR